MRIEDVSQRFVHLRPDRPADFEEMAEAVFRFQVQHNEVYRRFAGEDLSWTGWQSAPALPVEAFKLAPIAAFDPADAERVFESSGTARNTPSKHYVRHLTLYDRSLSSHFEHVFGSSRRIIVGHLPNYSDRGDQSSLVYMVQRLIERFGSEGSGFFLDDVEVLSRAIEFASSEHKPLLLFGAAFGLLDLLELTSIKLPPGSRVVETGGMKTFRREVTRADLHRRLAEGFGLNRENIVSEYGMTELLSQCYTRGGEVFRPPPWMRFRIVDPDDPAREMPDGRAGALHLFDLANIYTVSAVATQDAAIRRRDGFEVVGRVTGAELRGCNFLIEADD